MPTPSFAGAHTALVTPFRDGALDEAALNALIEAQVSAGISGIVPVGTTGESPTLSHEEHRRVIEIAVKAASKKILVIAGTGSNATSEAIELTIEADKLGADASLQVAPYYNKPSAEGLYRHFRNVAEAVSIPIILYSIPGRCGIEIPVPVVARLAADCPNVVAIKEAGGSVERVNQLRAALPASFQILSGDDALTLPFMASGAVGVISVASNIIPKEVQTLVQSFHAGDLSGAQRIHSRYYPLFRDLFIEPNPVPIKTALAEKGICTSDVRLPLCEMTQPNRDLLLNTLKSTGVL
ncbi:MAG: 4-hydroxy-tetrahydrodipicolinate synthase [Chthoniobacterales bacterium]